MNKTHPRCLLDRIGAKDYNLGCMDFKAEPKVLIDRREIEDTICRLAAQINKDYRNKKPVLVAVLKGAFIFLADLIRHLDLQPEMEFVCLSSYGQSRESSGKVEVIKGLCADIRGRDVLVIEDIIDTGITTSFLLDYLSQQEPFSVKVCALTSKPSRRKIPINIDYLGFEVPDRFLVGYGLDWDENFRHLPDLCFIEEE